MRTVYEVISPAEDGAETFWIGDRRIDPAHLGFVSTADPAHVAFDTRVPGNGAMGHDFWEPPLDPEDRLKIVKYLKDPERVPIPR